MSRTRYFYDLAIRHEDMHVEALTYSRQTLVEFAPPSGLGSARRPDAGPLPGDAAVPGDAGAWARRPATASSSTTRSGRTKPCSRRSVSHGAPVTNAEFAAFVEEGGYASRAFWSDAGWDWRQTRQRPAARLLAGEARWRVEREALPEHRATGGP